MVREVLEALRCKSGGLYVDGTVGGGGHALAILRASSPDGILIGIDQDDDALSESEKVLHAFGARKILVKGNFADMDRILAGLRIGQVDGLLLDLGVSSHQLDAVERGFSFSSDAPLDMRMDRSRKVRASDLVNGLAEKELARIIREYGEEIKAAKIARIIAERRKIAPVETTSELASLIAKAVGGAGRRGKIHPATRTFQALRIAVNEELENLHGAIVKSVLCLKKGGRFSIISFHSLEDRIVKNAFRSLEKGCICPADFPVCSCGREPQLKVLMKRPVSPGPGEIEENPRSRSAKLRTAERI
jgi:16S rRNA (cytosine1402-N4)-methyltransferase